MYALCCRAVNSCEEREEQQSADLSSNSPAARKNGLLLLISYK